MPPVARLISLGILTTLIVALGITFYHVLAPFLLPLFLAWVTAILCRPLYLWMVGKTNNRPRLAAGLTTAALLLIVLLPLVLGVVFAAAQLIELASTTIGDPKWRDKALAVVEDERVLNITRQVSKYLVELDTGSSDPNEIVVASDPAYDNDPFAPGRDGAATPEDREAEVDHVQRQIVASLRASLQYVGGRTIGAVGAVPGVALGLLGRIISLLVGLVMFAIGLYYFLCDGPELLNAAESLIPVRIEYQRELMARFDQVVRAVVLSTFLSALAQGFLTTVALAIAGFEHLLVFFVLASLLAMIPLAGTWLVWAPCAVWLALQEQSFGWAAFVILWGIGVVGTVDNVIRTYVLNTSAKLHPLLAFVSVLGGLQLMGLWGVFIAPVVAACLHALMQIFNAELKAFSHERLVGRGDGAEQTVTSPVIPEPPQAAAPVFPTPPEPSKPPRATAKPVGTAKGSKRRRR